MTRQSMVVLVVDQEPEPRQLVGGWLRNAGYPGADLSGAGRAGYTCAGGRGELCPLWKPLRRLLITTPAALQPSVAPGARAPDARRR
jgi:hypothetical protein